MSQVDHYLVIDLEATCDDQGAVPRKEMEIIEIGAVMVDGESFEAVDELPLLVRPVRHPRLTSFCTQLTTIQQKDVENAPTFPEALAELRTWMERFSNVTWCSWGQYDENQFQQDCRYHQMRYEMPPHLNLKKMYQAQRKLSRPVGMARALRLLGMELKGTHHRGIDDAQNIARLLPYALGPMQPSAPPACDDER